MFDTLCCFRLFAFSCFVLDVVVFDCDLFVLVCGFGLGWLRRFGVLVVGCLLAVFVVYVWFCLIICWLCLVASSMFW